jgi:hypothetical protein
MPRTFILILIRNPQLGIEGILTTNERTRPCNTLHQQILNIGRDKNKSVINLDIAICRLAHTGNRKAEVSVF